ncbi:MAG: dTDP-4-dehydrorhamnose reductase [Candidatus Sumerlaeota bacterium]
MSQKNPQILVTGAKGMLGALLMRMLPERGIDAYKADLPEHDLTDPDHTKTLIADCNPTHIIHCAAYTAVDKAEEDIEMAQKVNVEMTRNLAEACRDKKIWLLMVSTDFVFDGKAETPYQPEAPTNPLSVYGRTKRDAELVLASTLTNWQLARTAWLYGPGKRNFVSAMYERLHKGMHLKIVDDQQGCPTCTLDLAPRLIDLVLTEKAGPYHIVNQGQTTWCGLTKKIAEFGGFDPEKVTPIATEEYPVPAKRPKYSVLDCSKTWKLGIEPTRPWEEALAEYIDYLKTDYIEGKA